MGKRKIKNVKVVSCKNEYSIYNYLKNNPTIFIAFCSAVVAFVTFLSKITTQIMIKRTFAYWSFDYSHINVENSSVLTSALLAIIYSVSISLIFL